MKHELPGLPYSMDALAPHISRETLEYHYGKHHKAYLEKLNSLVEGNEFTTMSLEEIIKKTTGPLFNSAAQVWNHTFYWNCLSPKGGKNPAGKAADAITKSFGNFDNFMKEFSNSAVNNFGSGWTWLVKTKDGQFAIENTSNAGCPLKDGKTAVLTIDVWEHAYYIDYRNARAKYIEAFWNLVNWDFVNKNLR